MISIPRPPEFERASSRIWFIKLVRSSDRTEVEGTVPRTPRMASITIGSRRISAAWMPCTPTAWRNRTGSVMRQRANASTTRRRSSSGVTSSGLVGRPRMRPSYFTTLSMKGSLKFRPGVSCTSTTRPRRSTSAFSRSSTMNRADPARTATTTTAGRAKAVSRFLRAAISSSLRWSWWCRAGCPPACRWSGPRLGRRSAPGAWRRPAPCRAAGPAADRARCPSHPRHRRCPRR